MNRSKSLKTKFTRAIKHPEVIKRKIRINTVRPFTRSHYETISYVDEDWDNLIILDACRYDLIKENNPFDSPIKEVHSNASHTVEFLKNNFKSQEMLDTVYVSASPHLAGFEDKFVHVEHVWKDRWNDDKRTVLPEDVTEAAVELEERYPNKRLIVHYMQPHYPFIGKTGQTIENQATYGGAAHNKVSIWEQLAAGEISVKIVKKAYLENLNIVLPEVERLLNNIKGKSVITSDHGNLFGKRVVPWLPIKIYGHPPGIKDPELTAVPWIEPPYEKRKKSTSANKPNTKNEENLKEVEQRLQDFGYV